MSTHDDEKDQQAGDLSRRDFVALPLAAGMAAVAASAASAADAKITEQDVTIKTPDGTCDAAFIHPASGAHIVERPFCASMRPGRRPAISLASTGFRKPRCTIGKPRTAAWTCLTPSVCARWKTRTAS